MSNTGLTEAILNAEEALLGAILIDSAGGDDTAIKTVARIVSTNDFYGGSNSHHGRIYHAMIRSTQPPHQIVTAQTMQKLNTLQKGDCSYLRELVSKCPCSLDYESYARAVKEYSLQRQGIKKPMYTGAIY